MRVRCLVALAVALALPGAASAQTTTAAVTVDGRQRTYRLYVPPGPAPEAGRGLVVALHGGGRSETGLGMQLTTGLDWEADRHGFVVAYPDALRGKFDAGPCCTTEPVRDVAFVDAVVRQVRRRIPIDRRRITATGFSTGGFLAYRLACERSETFSAVAPVAAVLITRPCRPKRPVSVLHINGTKDSRYGLVGRFGSPRVRDHAKVWGRLDRCRSRSASRTGVVERISWTRCAGGARVRLMLLHGYGHGWPGALPPYGETTDPLAASRVIGSFLAR